MTIDGLLRALAELVDALPPEVPPFLVGGGLGALGFSPGPDPRTV